MKTRYFQYSYIALVIFYIALVALTPVDTQTMSRYNLSEPVVRLIGLSVSIPLTLIWLVALYGYSRFKSYAELIVDEKEGEAFGAIANGLMALVVSLPVISLASMMLNRISENSPNLETVTTIVGSYLPIVFQLAAFVLLAHGAIKLLSTVKPKHNITHSPAVMFGIIAFTSIFTYIIVARPFGGTVAENYAMPAWLVTVSIIVPLTFAWYMGGLAIYSLYVYRHKTRGIVYRRMLNSLVAGLGTIVMLSIIIQIVVSIAEQLTRLNFTPLLGIIYLLIAFYAVGYGLVAKGAHQLRKIEEV